MRFGSEATTTTREEYVVQIKFVENKDLPDWIDLSDRLPNRIEAMASLVHYESFALNSKHLLRIARRKVVTTEEVLETLTPT